MFTFYTDDVKMVRKNKPEVWSVVIEGEQPELMYRGYPYVSFIPGTQGTEEPLQSDKFVIDIDSGDTACKDAIKIVDWFSQIYGVEPEQWSVFLSGKKGIHLELSDTILGVENGHRLLMLAYKRLAKDIEGELDIKLDTSMYTRGVAKPYRQPNVMRDTGTCKRQIEFDDLYEIMTQEEYIFACSSPGPVWQPEDTERNALLAGKITYYLAEAEKQQEEIANTPRISDDDLDRLAASVPECIVILAGLEKATAGNTFNDIAMQLTAYAVTAGKSESEFMGGCQKFIANYPSSSLNTLAKRMENCRARFRTMAANGNQHSCGGIKALHIPGYNCDECPAKQAGPEITVEVMSREDIQKENLSLHIPEDILNPGGLISLGMEALEVPGMSCIKQYNMPVVLTTIANAIAGKITVMGVWPNIFSIKVGPTSTGKTSADKAIKEAIEQAGVSDFYGATDFASGPALMRSLVDQPINMMVIDECTGMFRRYTKGDAVADGKRDVLMEVYSASGGIIRKVYSDSKNTMVVESPCLSMTGNATTTIFDAIKQEDFDTGVMQRFDFWAYDGQTPERGIDDGTDNVKLAEFANGIKQIRNAFPADGGGCGMGGKFAPYPLDVTPAGRIALKDWSREVVAQCNSASSDGDRGIVSRQYDLSLKFALVHIAATRPPYAIFLPMDIQDIEYGKKVATMLAHWKIHALRGKVTTGDFHAMCEIFKQAISAVQKTGKRPTFGLMANRRPQLKNWKLRDSEEVISILIKRGEIVKDETERRTAYFRTKDTFCTEEG